MDRSQNNSLNSNPEESKVTDSSENKLIEENKTIAITIPKGAPTSNIASILLDNDLIESVEDFEKKVNDLDLEKSLRSGDYEFKNNMTLENIIKTIANKI